MRSEKTSISNEIRGRIEKSPFVILTDYTGLTVEGFTELRGRLSTKASARAMVVKNSLLRITLKELKLPDLKDSLVGPTAIVYGDRDLAAAASVLKTFHKEFKKPRIKAGILDHAVLSQADIEAIADLPSREALMAQLLGLFQAPASRFVRLMNTPAAQLVQVIKARSEKGEKAA